MYPLMGLPPSLRGGDHFNSIWLRSREAHSGALGEPGSARKTTPMCQRATGSGFRKLTEGILHENRLFGHQGFGETIDILSHDTKFVFVSFFQFRNGHGCTADRVATANPFTALLVAFFDDIIPIRADDTSSDVSIDDVDSRNFFAT